MWADTKYVTVKVMLITSILGPLILSGEFLYFRVIEPAQQAANATPPPVPDIIINIQPTPPVQIETETIVPEIPPTQRRVPGKHRAPEPTTVTPVPPASSRRIAPAEPVPSRAAPEPSGSSRVAPDPVAPPTTTPAQPTTTAPPTTGSSVSPVPPRPTTLSSTPIYDTLRRETMAADPSMPESAIPR